jgi:16S rRNA (guanine527-N7)-methyltransferase
MLQSYPTRHQRLELLVSIAQALAQGIRKSGIVVPDAASERFVAYIALLHRWNRVYNLTAVRQPEEMVGKHILDSLSVLPWLQGPLALDVGSGAGLPGIPLAIARGEMTFYLLDSNGKRVRFMRQAIAELELTNVQVVQCRAEDYHPQQGFNSVLTRAFASLDKLIISAGHLCGPGSQLLVMKGMRPDNELKTIPSEYTVQGVYPLKVPDVDAERHLVHLTRVKKVPV